MTDVTISANIWRRTKMIKGTVNLVLISALWVVVSCETTDFVSAPTTVKAPENNTVLLPCYLNTASTGKSSVYVLKTLVFPIKI